MYKRDPGWLDFSFLRWSMGIEENEIIALKCSSRTCIYRVVIRRIENARNRKILKDWLWDMIHAYNGDVDIGVQGTLQTTRFCAKITHTLTTIFSSGGRRPMAMAEAPNVIAREVTRGDVREGEISIALSFRGWREGWICAATFAQGCDDADAAVHGNPEPRPGRPHPISIRLEGWGRVYSWPATWSIPINDRSHGVIAIVFPFTLRYISSVFRRTRRCTSSLAVSVLVRLRLKLCPRAARTIRVSGYPEKVSLPKKIQLKIQLYELFDINTDSIICCGVTTD